MLVEHAGEYTENNTELKHTRRRARRRKKALEIRFRGRWLQEYDI